MPLSTAAMRSLAAAAMRMPKVAVADVETVGDDAFHGCVASSIASRTERREPPLRPVMVYSRRPPSRPEYRIFGRISHFRSPRAVRIGEVPALRASCLHNQGDILVVGDMSFIMRSIELSYRSHTG